MFTVNIGSSLHRTVAAFALAAMFVLWVAATSHTHDHDPAGEDVEECCVIASVLEDTATPPRQKVLRSIVVGHTATLPIAYRSPVQASSKRTAPPRAPPFA